MIKTKEAEKEIRKMRNITQSAILEVEWEKLSEMIRNWERKQELLVGNYFSSPPLTYNILKIKLNIINIKETSKNREERISPFPQ